MIFVNDLAQDYAWLTPAPIGTVEPGWAGIVADLLRDVGAAVATRPSTTVDVLGIAERDGALLFDAVIDGVGGTDEAVTIAVDSAAVIARARAAATCARCGRPGRLRQDRPGWPATQCDRHAGRHSY